VVIGLLFPLLLWIERPFLRSRLARCLIAALFVWKAATAVLLVQDGWCVRTIPSRPYATDATGAPHSWDIRADWRAGDPACSAIMTRPYRAIAEFPVWFFNLPPTGNAAMDSHDVPPGATFTMRIHGVLATRAPGTAQFLTTPLVQTALQLDGRPIDGTAQTILAAGEHSVAVEATLTGKRWQLIPLWNGGDLFSRAIATVASPRPIDWLMRPWGRWVTTGLVLALMCGWTVAALGRVRDRSTIAWSVAASGAVAGLEVFLPAARWHLLIGAIAAACLLPVAPRARNLRGLVWLVGVPWLTFVIVLAAPQIGRLSFYSAGDDFWRFQRWAYRIYLQGYWLEGGEPTFWFQPLYRWLAGALHLVFGDSSVGEWFWDGACLLVMATFSFEVTRRFAGFRWGTAAAVGSLALFLAGPGYVFIGRGLSEITSAGFVYLAALSALRSRHGSWSAAVVAGVCATMAFYTRLNNFPMAAAVVLFAWPVREPVATLARPSRWFAHVSMRTVAVVAVALAIGLLLFALRTWHYTGVFSVFRGTALDAAQGFGRRTWQPGASWPAGLASMYDSVMMVLTTTEPPHVHTGSIPLIVAAVVSMLALAGVPLLRQLPANAILFCVASLAGALVARGTAYSGRFSIHYVPIASAVVTCAAAIVTRRVAKLLG
jgi:hypothetical protein